MNDNNQFNDTMNDISGRLQDVIENGNKRRVLIRKENGDTLVNVTLTTAVVVVGLGMIFLSQLTILAGIVAIAAGVYTRASIELVREVGENSEVVTVEKRKNADNADDANSNAA